MKLLTLDYQGMAVYASREAWFNAIGCVLMGSYYPAVNGHLKVHHYGHLKVHHFKSGF